MTYQLPSKLTVKIKDDERSLKIDTLIYETYTIHPDDPIVKDCINRAIKDFGDEATDISLTITMTVL